MPASELIRLLQLMVKQYGDLRVLRADNGGAADILGLDLLEMRSIEPVILIR